MKNKKSIFSLTLLLILLSFNVFSSTEISFKTDRGINIAEKLFYVKDIKVLHDACSDKVGWIEGNGCYEAVIEWGKYNFEIKNGELKKLDDNIMVYWNIVGNAAYNGEYRGKYYNFGFPFSVYTQQYIVKIIFNNILDIEIDNDNSFLLLNDKEQICFDITNNLWEFENGGFSTKQTRDLISEYSQFVVQKRAIKTGTYKDCIDIPTDTYGKNIIEIMPYFDITNNQKYYSDKKEYIYYVINKKDKTDEGIIIEDEIINKDVVIPKIKEKQTFRMFFAGLIEKIRSWWSKLK